MTKTRCAIYTRKSSEEGLDQDFNSLDAQYEACVSYIASQRHEGWVLVKERYDGGISGGHLERPALQRLMDDVDAGRVSRIVVYKIDHLSPDLSRSMTKETLDAARDAISMAFGILPGMWSPVTTGPLVREAQRHLAQWMLQPIAALIAEEATAKLGRSVAMDVMRPLQAFDTGGRARAAAQIVDALATAQEAGVDQATAMRLVDWSS